MADIQEKKEHVGIVVVGHVDAGKSTTTGRLMFELGGIPQRLLDKYQREADALGKTSFGLAFIMDRTKEERERGITIQSTTQQFFTEKYHYSIIDAPGHHLFIKNMITGASQADVGLLLVPASKGAFEASIAKGDFKKQIPGGQTRQHARLLNLLGVTQIIVGINKMDAVDYDEERYTEIKNEVSKILEKIGFSMKKVPFIPISGYKGENLVKPSDKLKWYGGWKRKTKKGEVRGVTLLDALNAVTVPKRARKKPLRMPVGGILKISGVGNVITGRVEQGTAKPGMNVAFLPSNVGGKIFSIEMHHKPVEAAYPGDNVGTVIRFKDGNLPKNGDIMFESDDQEHLPVCPSSFRATVFVQEHPGKLKPGFTPSLHVRTAKAPCKMVKIFWKSGKSTGDIKVENPGYVEAGDQAEVIFEPQIPICVEAYDTCKPLGRIAIMDQNSLVMLGRVKEVYQDQQS